MGAAQFAFRDHVHAGAEARERAQHRLVGIGLHRVADERVLTGEGLDEHLIMADDRRGGIAVERRFDLARDRAQVDTFGMKDAVDLVKMAHGRSGPLENGIEDERPLRSRNRRFVVVDLRASGRLRKRIAAGRVLPGRAAGRPGRQP